MSGIQSKAIRATGAIAIVRLFVCLTVFASTANAQLPHRLYPRPPAVRLADREFASRVVKGSIVLGTIQKVVATGEAKIDPWHHPDRHEFRLEIKVEKSLFGAVPEETVLKVPQLWMNLNDWKSRLGENRLPSEGDRVIFQYKPADLADRDQEKIFNGAELGPAHETELKRLRQVSHILKSSSAEEAAQLVLNGCQDDDPHFARWCLIVSETGNAYSAEPYQTVYGNIRRHISPPQNLEVCWSLLQSPKTHSLVYQAADYRLSREKLTASEQEKRHRCHLQRLEQIVTGDTFAEADIYYRVFELKHLLSSVYPRMPLDLRIELIQRLKTVVHQDHQHSAFKVLVATYAPSLNAPDNQACRDELFKFYQGCLPLRATKDSYGYGYRGGLIKLMKQESLATSGISSTGLDLLIAMITLGDADCAYQSASSIEGYAKFCRREEIAWPELPLLLTSLIKNCPHRKAQEGLEQAAGSLDVELVLPGPMVQ
ncbi:hypothetical protein AB1K70_24650 [Bremerella sp. JC770]|uniref:hypothetical protein n=1 Tax=Bremerella sp. JC770 TaxID=3232137 RepID=UPI0034596041